MRVFFIKLHVVNRSFPKQNNLYMYQLTPDTENNDIVIKSFGCIVTLCYYKKNLKKTPLKD